MKRTSIKAFLFAAAIMLAVLPGCKKFLDINENPNATTNVDPPLILPSLEAAVAHVISYQYQNYGNFWSQYWTQVPSASQFRSLDAYSSGPSDFDRGWSILYADALQDADSLISKGGTAKYQQYTAIAWIMRAYVFQLLTDGFGDVPLKDALMGRENRSPAYDSQQEVYDSIFKFIETGTALIDEASAFHPGTDDMLLGGNMASWRQFANTLKLRAYMRLSEVDNAKAKAGVEALYAAGAKFLTANVDMKWTSQGGNNNPLWAEVVALQVVNQVASSSVVNVLKANSDPRLTAFYRTIGGQVYSINQGSFNSVPSNVTVSLPSTGVHGHTAPGRLISAAESYFLQAEAAARGWSSGNAEELFKSGIRSSFATYNLAAQADNYIATAGAAQFPVAGTLAEKIEAIIVQKWLAMCGNQGFEAWCELRRTGYPSFLEKSEASILGNENMPARFIYPQAELTRNANFPGLKKIDEKMWWDK